MQTPQATTSESPASMGAHHAAMAKPTDRYLTIPQCAGVRPFTAAALRDMKFKAHDRKNSRGEVIAGNGTGPAGVWIQIGSKVLIDLDAFDAWIGSHRLTTGQ
ncbi:MAG: hypothetical protein Q8O52_20925 [Sulfuritalea sp.]|nr:hypothetical protein [Sulfuritalea sp.]